MQGRNLYQAPSGTLEPADVIPASFAATDEARRYREQGEDLLCANKLAVVIVAGGQGSRLGIEAPKGVVKVSPVKQKSLFQVHTEKIVALNQRYKANIPLFIMTSRANDRDIRDFFQQHNFFGLDQDDVYFFIQGMLPSLSEDGKFILAKSGGLFMNPDGHGGTFNALQKNGCLDIMKKRGVEEIFYLQVDNPLVALCDPLFIGLHYVKGAQMSSKVVRKRDAEEKVGVIARVGGKTCVVEYSDMSDKMRYATNDKGEMLYWAGSIAIHLLRRDFVEALTQGSHKLPYHKAYKKIPSIDSEGKPVEIEGIKFETFLFDALSMTKRSITMEVKRDVEFAPVKNKIGEDSLESCVNMQNELFKSWLEHAGVEVKPGIKIEISPLFALDEHMLESRADEIPGELSQDTYLG